MKNLIRLNNTRSFSLDVKKDSFFSFKIDAKIRRFVSSTTRHKIELRGCPKSNTF